MVPNATPLAPNCPFDSKTWSMAQQLVARFMDQIEMSGRPLGTYSNGEIYHQLHRLAGGQGCSPKNPMPWLGAVLEVSIFLAEDLRDNPPKNKILPYIPPNI